MVLEYIICSIYNLPSKTTLFPKQQEKKNQYILISEKRRVNGGNQTLPQSFVQEEKERNGLNILSSGFKAAILFS